MNSLKQVHRGTIRPFAARHPGLVLLSLTTVGVALGIRYQAGALKKNDAAQRTSNENYYVSVDRSGGGI
ncbi:hypothetical protein BD289DRAFT_484132 [Coniella lustricola]|uniref:Uncharacterized protein n=1 Tax=Coniella lustricola TaxID=2025994 RepID=A0A2T3A389_9PEZI|nr:hypothetical protein BD289DRAFT_484132 [Coniella lustricola]